MQSNANETNNTPEESSKKTKTESYARKGLRDATLGVVAPVVSINIPTWIHRSTEGKPDPLRQMDMFGLPDFLDHAGNTINGVAGSAALITAGLAFERFVPEEKKPAALVGLAALSAAGSAGVNVAYEAGVHIPPFQPKSPDAKFDSADALYGSVAGILMSGAFCLAALKHRSQAKKLRKQKEEIYASYGLEYKGE